MENRPGEAALLRGDPARRDRAQLICNRERVVAAVIDADSADKLRGILEREGHRSIAASFEEFRALAKHGRYVLKTRRRQNRRNRFADALDHLPR